MILDPLELKQGLPADDEVAEEPANDMPVAKDVAAVQDRESGEVQHGNRSWESNEDDDDNVIQRYMERLIKRVSSKGGEEEDWEEQPETDELPAENPRVSSPSPSGDRSSCDAEITTPETTSPDSQQVATSDQEKDVRDETTTDPSHRPGAAAADLLAMRELANNTARDAIETSDRRRSIATVAAKLTVGSVCLACSGAVVFLNQRPLSPSVLAAVIGSGFGSYVLYRAVCTYRAVLRKATQD